MASELAVQLARIRSQSENPLDLKKRKTAHAQSILFDARAAATQDFDTIYQICYEGFEDLCHLDPAFTAFRASIFSDQSKDQDRTRMTITQNEELDIVLEQFLGLISGRLLLRPALKAIEWIIRRFRVHEYNTLYFATMFLPYHAHHLFVSMLTILPRNLPQQLIFLRPCIQSLTNPSRQSIIQTASKNRAFLTALTKYVFGICRNNREYPALVSLWSSIAIEALAWTLETGRVASRENNNEQHEDVLRYFLPMISDGLRIPNAQDLRTGCYMVLIVLATKADLGDEVLSATMQAVVFGWDSSSHAGLICLGVLSQRSQQNILPRKVLKAIISLPCLCDDLVTLQKHYQLENLLIGIVLGLLEGLQESIRLTAIPLLESFLDAGLLHEQSVSLALTSISPKLLTRGDLNATDGKNVPDSTRVQQALSDLIHRSKESQRIGDAVQCFNDNSRLEVTTSGNLGSPSAPHVSWSSPSKGFGKQQLDKAPRAAHSEKTSSLQVLLERYAQSADHAVYLSDVDADSCHELQRELASIDESASRLRYLLELPSFQKQQRLHQPLFLSFCIRVWCGNCPTKVRAASLQCVTESIARGRLCGDLQILLPYTIYALSDASFPIRQAAANLVLALSKAYHQPSAPPNEKAHQPTTEKVQVYGPACKPIAVTWLSPSDLTCIIDLLVPGLEECLLDESCVVRIIVDSINGVASSKISSSTGKSITLALRTSLFVSLCSHVVNSPIYSFKLRLLKILNKIESVASATRTKLLLPLEAEISASGIANLRHICERELININELVSQIACIFSSKDKEGIYRMKSIVEHDAFRSFRLLQDAVIQRMTSLWPNIKTELHMPLVRALLCLVMSDTERPDGAQEVAIGALRSVQLSSSDLQSLLAGLPRLGDLPAFTPSLTKRRRISISQRSMKSTFDPRDSNRAIREITVILEMIESSRAAKCPALLEGLCHVAFDLRFTGLLYLQVLVLEEIYSVLSSNKSSATSAIDLATIRADAIVDYIRTTASPQVRNVALLVASELAELAPDQILHSVMPIFAYMGATVLRQDDEYSAHIVQQVVESVVPSLVTSLHKNKKTAHADMSELLLNFAAAFEHIPNQRRLPLFVSLLEKIGAPEYLSVLVYMMMTKYSYRKQVIQFSVQLTCQFDIATQLKMTQDHLQIILDMWNLNHPANSNGSLQERDENTLEKAYRLLDFTYVHISSKELPPKTSNLFQHSGIAVTTVAKEAFASVIKRLLFVFEFVNASSEVKCTTVCVSTLNATLMMLPLSHLIDIMEILFKQVKHDLRLPLLLSFQSRMSRQDSLDRASRLACVNFLPFLVRVLEDPSYLALRKAAVSTIDLLSERFGKTHCMRVVEAASTISGDMFAGLAFESSLRAASLLCLSTMIEVAGDMIVPVVPNIFSMTLANLNASVIEHEEDANLHDAAVSVIQALAIYVPWMMTGENLVLILIASQRSAAAHMGISSDRSRLEAVRAISRQEHCLLAIEKTWKGAINCGAKAILEHIEILRLTIDQMSKPVVRASSVTLADMFLQAFELRQHVSSSGKKGSFDDDVVGEIEEAVNECVIAMIYKLNDTTFRPIFERFMAWATNAERHQSTSLDRSLTWYTFLLYFFQTLKSIVMSYAELVATDTIDVLQHVDPSSHASMQLWRKVLQTLRAIFVSDKDNYIRRFSGCTALADSLIAQFAFATNISMTDDLIPCIVELAVASGSSVRHKELNHSVLKSVRSDSSSVRLAAVQCELALTDRMGEEWLHMLPEMLPIIAELQEDDDEMVERETLRWIQSIENILGESLNSMLR